ncbi:MICOS complex subunit MIC27 [Rhinophrynus dorsalis]
MVSKLFKLAAVPAGLAFTSYGLYAVSDRDPKGNHLSPNQLSIYCVPPHHSKYIEEQPGRLQTGFSVVRKTVWPYVIWGEHACSSIKSGVQDTVQFGKDSYVYLKNPPPEFLARVGVITVSGLAGLVLARKGSRLKKIVYPLGLTTLGISVCYPAQAVIFAKLTGRKISTISLKTYDTISSLWKTSPHKEDIPQAQYADPQSLVSVIEEDQKIVLEQNTTSVLVEPEPPILLESERPLLINEQELEDHNNEALPNSDSEKQTKFQPDPKLSDHGQSNPEDADLYSTRS